MTKEEAALEIGSALELVRGLTSRLRELADYIARGETADVPQNLQIEYAEIAEINRQSERALKKCAHLVGDELVADWIPVTIQKLQMTTEKGILTHFQEKKVILERTLAKLELEVVRRPFGSGDTPGAFLSHNWNDKWFVRKLAAELESYGVRVWLDEAELKIGDSLVRKVHEAVGKASYVIAVISRGSVKSEWVLQELETAMSIQIAKGQVRVLPIVIEDVGDEMPAFLLGKLFGDFRDQQKFFESAMKLAASMGTAKSATELINGLPPEDSASKLRRCSLKQVRDARRILRSLSVYPEMDLPENRRALLWHGASRLLRGEYPFEVIVGSHEKGGFEFMGWDTLALQRLCVMLTSAQAERGIWEFEFFPTEQDQHDRVPPLEQRPTFSAETFVGSGRLSHYTGRSACPTSSRAEDQIQPLVEIVQQRCASFDTPTKRSFLLDLQHIALARTDRVITYRVGKIGLDECSTFDPHDGMTTDPVACCNAATPRSLYFQILDSFFQSSNSIFLCECHQERLWDANVNFLRNSHHCLVLGPH